MGRKGRSVTLSLSDEDKARLESLALEYDMTWGDRPNISKLIEAIARKTLKIAPNHDWPRALVEVLIRAQKLLEDAGRLEEAKMLAKLLCDRSELTLPQRHELEQFLTTERSWRLEIERYINRQQPFRLSYQDAADNVFQFTIYHAQIVPRGDRLYLDCWCEDTEGSQDIPELAHNRTLRLDRITEAAIAPMKASWREDLDTVAVEMYLYGGLAFNYSSKQGRDVVVEWLAEAPQTRRVVRNITSTFWFMRDVLPYGGECEVIGPADLREKVEAIAQQMYQRYSPKA